MPARATAGGRGAFSSVDSKKNRMAPYGGPPRKGNKPGCIGEEEIENLIKLDEGVTEMKTKLTEAKEKLRELKKNQRDSLDECKKENRGGKLNGQEIQRVQEIGTEKIEEMRVVLLGRIADDKSMWEEHLDDPTQTEQQETLKSRLATAVTAYNASKSAYESIHKRSTTAATEVAALKRTLHELEQDEIQINVKTAQLEASKALLCSKRDAARETVLTKEDTVSKVMALRMDTNNQLQSATDQRKRMEARVSLLSNNIKGCLWLGSEHPMVETTGLRGTEVKIGSDEKKAAFELDSVAVGACEVMNAKVVTNTMQIYVAASGNIPAEPEKCFAYGQQLVPGAVVSACEVYNDTMRDLLKDNAYQELALMQPDVLDSFDRLTATATPDIGAIMAAYKLRALKTQLRHPTTLYFHFKSQTSPAVLTMMCVPFLSRSDADPTHILNPFVKMYSDPKEARLMLKRTTLGRHVAHIFPEVTTLSVIGVASCQTPPQGVIDVCRLIHRCMMVDIGVRKE
eukprot:TRINITY_DN13918_c0_g1_i1.p1 TRINITY_DN13918_c0_g1~~TRINITY_DN13918_c0_g1_i1.p1  ORF type:complete len:535 (+),score=132.31 TRINITY_DN13918_c0_g1_i1:68-1606(+)